jgi:hypothetical protein
MALNAHSYEALQAVAVHCIIGKMMLSLILHDAYRRLLHGILSDAKVPKSSRFRDLILKYAEQLTETHFKST